MILGREEAGNSHRLYRNATVRQYIYNLSIHVTTYISQRRVQGHFVARQRPTANSTCVHRTLQSRIYCLPLNLNFCKLNYENIGSTTFIYYG